MFENMKKREPATREEYVAELCLKNGCTQEFIERALDIEQCDTNCSYPGCTGWIAHPKRKLHVV